MSALVSFYIGYENLVLQYPPFDDFPNSPYLTTWQCINIMKINQLLISLGN